MGLRSGQPPRVARLAVRGEVEEAWSLVLAEGRMVLSRDGVAIDLSNDHVASREDEKRRIESSASEAIRVVEETYFLKLQKCEFAARKEALADAAAEAE